MSLLRCLPRLGMCAALLSLLVGAAWAVGEACPDYHREDKVYAAKVKDDLKRYARSEGVPERLMYLYDQLGDCPACLGGDALHPILPFIYIVYAPDSEGLSNIRSRGTAWNADEEYAARQGMRDGNVEAFYILLEETPCECCRATTEEEFDEWDASEPDWEDSPDWNDELDIDTSRSDAHDNVDELGPDPADLTEVGDKNRFPDELPVPALVLPPPVRPMTTGCSACQILVAEYNGLAIRINQQSRFVALNERRLKIGQIAIRFALREIRAHNQKARTESWEVEYDRLRRRVNDLMATSQEDQRQLDMQIAARDDLLAQLALLRASILECEERCRLPEDQPAPTTDPDPLPETPADADGPMLPPYVRIASQTCATCAQELEQRNNVARDMNELVQGMIDAGINSNSIAAWEALRIELTAANNALHDCISRCPAPAASAPMLHPDAELTSNACEPCRMLQENLDRLRGKFKELSLEAYELKWNIRAIESEKLNLTMQQRDNPRVGVPARLREIENELRRLGQQFRRLNTRIDTLRDLTFDAEVKLRYCQATQCEVPDTYISGLVSFPRIIKPTNIHQPGDTYFVRPIRLVAEQEHFFFVFAKCDACDGEARETNSWLLQQFETWLTPEFLRSMKGWGEVDQMTVAANRYRFLEFLNELNARIARLLDCEQRACSLTRSHLPYREEDIAPDECLESAGTKSAAENGNADALPDSCSGSWLEHWLLSCEDGDCDGAGAGAKRSSQDIAGGNPNDSYFRSSGNVTVETLDQWGLHRIGAYDAIAADERYAVTGHTTIVAVIDSGLDIQHPDLGGKIWRNLGELPGNNFDDDGNGFIDDVHGWNFVGNDNDVRDHNGHGTLVAGIVGAATDNGIGIAGVNPWAKIMPIKVTNFLGRGSSVDVAAAITYAVDEGARVINVSLGGNEFSADEQSAVGYAASKDVLVVVAAGNESVDASGFWPAGLDNVITVAAMEPDDSRARYSNWGSPVDIAAPGSNILSLRARYTDLMYFVEDDYPRGRNIIGDDRLLYQATGTSFAAPFVAGVASLLMSLRPELNVESVRRMLLHSATDVETPGIDSFTGFGVVNAPAALAADPEYFVDAAITGVAAIRRDGATYIQVKGTADAYKYESAELQFGAGEAPSDWQDAGELISSPVHDGLLAEIDATKLSGSPIWTLRLLSTNEDGTRREVRFELNLQ